MTLGSHKKVWWLGKCGHEWQADVVTRVNNHGCPYCSSNKVLYGYNDLSTINPVLAEEWHPTRNEGINPSSVSSTSHIIVWWLGKCGHEWQAAVSSRAKGQGCPFCSNKRVLVGFNDLETTHPEIASEWHKEKNIGISPINYTCGSEKKVWWLGKCGHEWQAPIYSRTSGRGCPICAGRKILIGFNDLASQRPDLVKQWHPSKNQSLNPDSVTAQSNNKVWWICDMGHEWCASVASRVAGLGCPVCSNRKIIAGYNDLETLNPDLANEWHPTKNNGIFPNMVSLKSGKKVWWICKKGHEWQAQIASRANGRGCPICNQELQTSFPEQAIYYYLKKHYPDAINSDTTYIDMELDIYVPSIRTAIEYDGYNWHKNSSTEQLKNAKCNDNGITLIRIREEGLPLYTDCICIIRRNRKANTSLADIIKQIFRLIDSPLLPDVDIDRDYSEILESYISGQKEKSLGLVEPLLAEEWHPTKNGKLMPDMVSYGSKKKVWWLGKCGHEWQSGIIDRVRGNGCPFCASRKLLSGFNDLATISPSITKEWHPFKNGQLSPDKIMSKSSKKVWWLGICGHEWQATIVNRVHGSGCPICSSNKVLAGFNDFLTTNPVLASEWHPTKNGSLSPSMITSHSNKTVWWKCKEGHEWQAKVNDRTNGNNCPVCAGVTVVKGINDLQTTNPDLAEQWHPTKNGELLPTDYSKGSNKKIWWLGVCGHEWEASITSRVSGHGCPVCSGKTVLPGVNDLGTNYPKLALEWNNSKNGALTPYNVMPKANIKVWWICSKGHEWQALISSRANGTGCPICSGRVVVSGYNDFGSQFPELLAEWHPTKNGTIKPDSVSPFSHRKVWWICEKGHEWEAVIAKRSAGQGCPICSGHRVLTGYNDLATLKPELAKQWHPDKNEGLLPDMVSTGSSKKVWWICQMGHEWQASIKNRINGTGCPFCQKQK